MDENLIREYACLFLDHEIAAIESKIEAGGLSDDEEAILGDKIMRYKRDYIAIASMIDK